MSTNIKHSIATINDKIRSLESRPGVYQFWKKEKCIYIGKAKSIPKRLLSYTQINKLPNRLKVMVSQIEHIKTIFTSTEVEALLLEAQLIRELKPRFNIMLTDDKTYPYIKITMSHDYPRIMKYRTKNKPDKDCYGPFPSVSNVEESIKAIQHTFLLRSCSDNMFAHRTRPCIQHQIKRCSAPCVKKISLEDYKKDVSMAVKVIKGNSHTIKEQIKEEMEKASDEMNYERAIILRNRISAIQKIQTGYYSTQNTSNNIDAIGIYKSGTECCISILFVRDNINIGHEDHIINNIDPEDPETQILRLFIMQFYQTRVPPEHLILNHYPEELNLLQIALNKLSGTEVEIAVCKENKFTVLACDSAKSSLKQKINLRNTNLDNMENLRKIFKLSTIPQRIEVYDNSHIMGTDPIGAMIVAGEKGFMKNEYRRFNIQSDTKGDDYQMLHEVLIRRLTRMKEKSAEFKSMIWPDFMIIDGGIGHMSVVLKVFKILDLDIPFTCISKGPNRNSGDETFHLPGHAPMKFAHNHPLLYYLQRLRDEAHRFAIGSHRIKRKKRFLSSPLDAVKGIGVHKKKMLLASFNNDINAIKSATTRELLNIPGISTKIAHDILHVLNNKAKFGQHNNILE